MAAPLGTSVIVIGGSLAGMAAAARLAKAGHTVRLLERRTSLGGRLGPDEAMPAVLGFPAPWRDLFTKSGRPLEAELTRAGLALVPAPPTRHVFADQTELILPTERGAQTSNLTRAYGPRAALRWRDLLDELDQVWQVLRPLGQESELRDRSQLTRRVRKRLRYRRTIDDLARSIDEPHLAAIIRSVATRLGSEPRRTPAWCAVQLSIDRTFGRWSITDADGPVEATRLIQLLADRLELRRVEVAYQTEVTKIIVDAHGAARGVAISRAGAGPAEELTGDAVICATDPWQCYDGFLDPHCASAERRALHQVSAAQAPTVSRTFIAAPAAEAGGQQAGRQPVGGGQATTKPMETVVHSDTLDTVIFELPQGDGHTLRTSHDYTRTRPVPGAGIAWQGPRSWLRRPPIRSSVDRLFLAGPHSRGGAGPPQIILSGALASYACHDLLSVN